MDVMDAILSRKSIRKFTDQDISEEIIQKILEAGIRAPSGGNRQPWRFIVVKDREKIRLFDPESHQPWVENAPAVIVVCANPHDTWEKYDEEDSCYILDTAAAVENMLLAIHGLGLGAVWILSFSKRTVRKLLNIPLHWQIVSIIPFGYYQEKDSTDFEGRNFNNIQVRPRKPLSAVAFWGDALTPFGKEAGPEKP